MRIDLTQWQYSQFFLSGRDTPQMVKLMEIKSHGHYFQMFSVCGNALHSMGQVGSLP